MPPGTMRAVRGMAGRLFGKYRRTIKFRVVPFEFSELSRLNFPIPSLVSVMTLSLPFWLLWADGRICGQEGLCRIGIWTDGRISKRSGGNRVVRGPASLLSGTVHSFEKRSPRLPIPGTDLSAYRVRCSGSLLRKDSGLCYLIRAHPRNPRLNFPDERYPPNP